MTAEMTDKSEEDKRILMPVMLKLDAKNYYKKHVNNEHSYE